MADYIQIKNGTTDAMPVAAESSSTYCKMPDGTLICWGRFMPNYANNNVGTYTVTYPVSFTSVPMVVASVGMAQHASGELAINVKIATKTTTQCSFGYHDPNGNLRSDGSYIKDCYYIAIGRWK